VGLLYQWKGKSADIAIRVNELLTTAEACVHACPSSFTLQSLLDTHAALYGTTTERYTERTRAQAIGKVRSFHVSQRSVSQCRC
jgi:hypothetical protein